MIPEPANDPGRPRNPEGPDNGHAADAHDPAEYLRALGELTRHHAHAVRARIGTVALQLDLASELLGSGGDVTRARDQVGRARTNLRELVDALEAFFALTRPPASEGEADLQGVLRQVEAALLPMARDRMIELVVEPPPSSVMIAGPATEVRDALLIASLRSLASLPPNGRLELSLGGRREGAREVIVSSRARQGVTATPDEAAAGEIAGGEYESKSYPHDDRLVLMVPTLPANG